LNANEFRPMLAIQPLTELLEQQARDVIESGLREHWPNYDSNRNPDIQQLLRTYGTKMLIGLIDHQVVATGAWTPVSASVARIVRMSVASPYRRQGLASRILKALEEHIAEQRYSRIVLETTTHWQDAVRFYSNQGYRPTHHLGGDTYFFKDIT